MVIRAVIGWSEAWQFKNRHTYIVNHKGVCLVKTSTGVSAKMKLKSVSVKLVKYHEPDGLRSGVNAERDWVDSKLGIVWDDVGPFCAILISIAWSHIKLTRLEIPKTATKRHIGRIELLLFIIWFNWNKSEIQDTYSLKFANHCVVVIDFESKHDNHLKSLSIGQTFVQLIRHDHLIFLFGYLNEMGLEAWQKQRESTPSICDNSLGRLPWISAAIWCHMSQQLRCS